MAANMPQMVLLQQQQQQKQNLQDHANKQQLHPLIHNYIVSSYAAVPPNSWQHQVSRGERYAKVMTLCSNVALAMPQATMPMVFKFVAEFEKAAWTNSPDKATYDQQFAAKVADWLRKRQMNAPELQNQLTVDAARQAQQAQQQQHQIQQQQQHLMMMNMGRMGQPGQPGFPHMQNPMQMSTMPPQAQMGMGMVNPGMMQNRPDQRPFPMGMAQQPMHFTDANQLTPADRQRLHNQAEASLMKASEQERANARQAAMKILSGPQLAQVQAEGVDLALWWFKQKALGELKAARMQQQQQQRHLQQQQQHQRGLVGNFMPPGMQNQMNPNLMNQLQQGGPNGQMMEAIHNEHQKAMLAQQHGQLVVPASSGPGRNPTPGPIAGLPPQAIQQGLNQMPRQPMQQPFGLQPQNVKLENPMTAQQLQQAQQARAMAMQNQSGALSGLPATSQSPGMNPINPSMRQPPGHGGPPGNQEGNPQVGNLNPNFNHQNNTRPQAVTGAMNNAGLTAGVGALPDSSVEEVMKTWGSHQRPLMNSGMPNKPVQGPGMPGQLQAAQAMPNQLGAPNSVQKPGMVVPPGLQQAAKAQLLNYARTPQGKAAMDNLDIPPPLLVQIGNLLKGSGFNINGVDIRKWGQLWQFLQNNPTNPRLAAISQHLSQSQVQHFINMWERKVSQSSQVAPTPNGVPVANVPVNPQQIPATLPPGQAFPPTVTTATPAEIQNIRERQPQFSNLDDNSVANIVVQMKRHQYLRRAWQLHNGNNNNNNNQVPGAQRTPVQPNMTPFPQPANPAISRPTPPLQTPAQTPAQKPVLGPGLDAAVPTPAAANKLQRPQQQQPQQLQQSQPQQQPQQSQPQQPARPNPSPVPVQVPAPKGSNPLKRPSPDDAPDGPVQPNNTVQRPTAQPTRPPGQIPPISEAQLANLPPEQRARYEAMLRRNQEQLQTNQNDPLARLRTLANDENQKQASQPLLPVHMSAEEYQEASKRVIVLWKMITSMRPKLSAWWAKTGDEAKGRAFFRARHKITKQYEDKEMTKLRNPFTITLAELDNIRGVVTEIVNECVKLGLIDAPHPPAAPAAANNARASQPLSAENLEKLKAPSRPMQKGGQPPPAPTTTQAPYPLFSHPSPGGNPEYLSEQRLNPENLVIPARKKPKPNPAPQVAKPGHGSSSPVVKAPSPVVARKPDPVLTAPKYTCPYPDCEMASIGFQTEDALNSHREEEHIKPYENPLGFLRENMTAALGLDAQGHSKPLPKAAGQEAAPQMKPSLSRQGQTPSNKPEMAATPMSRDASMRRQGSAPGARVGDNATQAVSTEDAWAQATIDPSTLFSGLGAALDSVTGHNMIADFGAYRSVTPNDTPESSASKDSGVSEPNSDITEGATLEIDLNWHSMVESDLLLDMNSFSMGMEGMERLDTSMFDGPFSLDDMQTDFSKPFVFDSSLYSMDPTV